MRPATKRLSRRYPGNQSTVLPKLGRVLHLLARVSQREGAKRSTYSLRHSQIRVRGRLRLLVRGTADGCSRCPLPKILQLLDDRSLSEV